MISTIRYHALPEDFSYLMDIQRVKMTARHWGWPWETQKVLPIQVVVVGTRGLVCIHIDRLKGMLISRINSQNDGMALGCVLGSSEGYSDGRIDGIALGCFDGRSVGCELLEVGKGESG